MCQSLDTRLAVLKDAFGQEKEALIDARRLCGHALAVVLLVQAEHEKRETNSIVNAQGAVRPANDLYESRTIA